MYTYIYAHIHVCSINKYKNKIIKINKKRNK